MCGMMIRDAQLSNCAFRPLSKHSVPLFGHIERMPDETYAKKILTAPRTGGDHQDSLMLILMYPSGPDILISSNLSLNEAIDVVASALETDVHV